MSVRGSLARLAGPTPAAPAASVRADHWPVTGRDINRRRVVLLTIAGLLVLVAAAELRALAGNAALWSLAGRDYELYLVATSRWMAGGPFYEPQQIAGPYAVAWGAILYPPPMLLLFVPFTVLPWALWWTIPIVVTVWMIAWNRPRLWAIVVMLAIAVISPWSFDVYVSGTPTIWFVAAIALATRWPAASAFVLLKPTLLPFALLGVWRRGWWLAGVGMVAAALLMLPMTLDWLRVMLNAREPEAGILYSAQNIPLMLIPLVAWAGRRRELIEATRGISDH